MTPFLVEENGPGENLPLEPLVTRHVCVKEWPSLLKFPLMAGVVLPVIRRWARNRAIEAYERRRLDVSQLMTQ
jgi:hypothetical protein